VTKFGSTTNPVRGCENSVFRFQKLEISSPLFSPPLILFVRFVLFVVHNLRIFEKDVIHESNAVFKGFA
jgi:hypothetical protein